MVFDFTVVRNPIPSVVFVIVSVVVRGVCSKPSFVCVCVCVRELFLFELTCDVT